MESNLEREYILDFFGLPGSGKTTIAHMIARKLNEDGYKIQESTYFINNEYSLGKRILVKTLYTFNFTIKHFSFMCELFFMLEKGAFKSWKEAVKQWVNICFVLTVLNKKNNNQYIIADQGIVQAAISLGIHSEKASVVDIYRKLCEKTVKPIKFVYVEVDNETSLKRLNSRENLPINYENTDYAQIQLQIVTKKCEEILNAIDCITIDNNKTLWLENSEDSYLNNFHNILTTLEVLVKENK